MLSTCIMGIECMGRRILARDYGGGRWGDEELYRVCIESG